MKQNIKLFVMDVDGTLTDGSINITSTGELYKAFDVKDGYGIKILLPENGVKTAIITGRESDIVAYRASELDITYVYQGINNKEQMLKRICSEMAIEMNEVAYIGDDLNDISAMEMVGIAGCPSDAIEQVKNKCHYISSKTGGNGAVRDFIDWLIKQN